MGDLFPLAGVAGTPSIEIKIPGSELDLRIRAVNAAIELYANKTVANFGDYNIKFKELYTEIYNFYGTNKQELH